MNTNTPGTTTNYHHLIMDIAWFGLALAATSRFLSVYAIRLGATPLELGWLTSLPFVVLLGSTALSTWWRSRYPDSIRALTLPSLGFRLVFLLPALTPFFPMHLQPLWLIVSVTLPALPQGISNTLFIVMMREAVPHDQLTQLMSRRSMWMNVTIGAAALAFGLWLEQVPFPVNYQIMFIFAFLVAMISHWHVLRVRVQPVVVERPKRHVRQTQPSVSPLRSPAFIQTIIIAVVLHIGFFSILPVTPLHLVQTLGATEGFMALFGTAELTAAALICLFTDRIARRIGHRRMVGLAMIGTAIASAIMAAAHTLPVTLIGAAISGAAWSATTIGLFGVFTESVRDVDDTEMPRYSTLYHQVIFLAAFIGPMLGSNLANAGISLVVVMLGGTALRLLAAGTILQLDSLQNLAGQRFRRRAQTGENAPLRAE